MSDKKVCDWWGCDRPACSQGFCMNHLWEYRVALINMAVEFGRYLEKQAAFERWLIDHGVPA